MAAAAADDDRWKTGPAVAAAVVDRATVSNVPSIATAVGSCARFAAGSSDLAPKGSTRLSSN